MGNTNTKKEDNSNRLSFKRKSNVFVDKCINYGSLIPQGIYTAEPEYDIEIVRQFIVLKKLAPFYKGMPDYLDDPFPTSPKRNSHIEITQSPPQQQQQQNNILSSSPLSQEIDIEKITSTEKEVDSHQIPSNINTNTNSNTNTNPLPNINTNSNRNSIIKKKRFSKKSIPNENDQITSFSSTSSSVTSVPTSPNDIFSKNEFFKYPVECPICFLYYPRNINYTRCCDQPICTECFIQIKRTYSNPEPTCCPYCVHSNFGVYYFSPESDEYLQQYEILIKVKEYNDENYKKLITQGSTPGKKRRSTMSHTDRQVVTSDDIYPGWMVKYEQYIREQQRMEELRIRSHNSQLRGLGGENPNAALLNALFRIPIRGYSSHSNHSTSSSTHGQLRVVGGEIEELMVLEAIRRSLIEAEQAENNENDNQIDLISDENSINNSNLNSNLNSNSNSASGSGSSSRRRSQNQYEENELLDTNDNNNNNTNIDSNLNNEVVVEEEENSNNYNNESSLINNNEANKQIEEINSQTNNEVSVSSSSTSNEKYEQKTI